MSKPMVAYFSMEIALEDHIPTYAGGLGVLAGDAIRSAADLQIPMVAISLVHRKGYFSQTLNEKGWQSELSTEWDVESLLEEVPNKVNVTIDGQPVHIRAWKYEVEGADGYCVPVYLLDTDVPDNNEWVRSLTDKLYGGDYYYRICQEVVLGIGGIRMLRALGFDDIERFHMNEGHSSLLGLELLEEEKIKTKSTTFHFEHVEAVRQQCVFTTHTPVDSGHDKFDYEEAVRILGLGEEYQAIKEVICWQRMLNMTSLALNLSHYINGVAKMHQQISRTLFPCYEIDSITNGVHAATWVSPEFTALFDQYISGWRKDNFSLRYALNIPREDIWQAHMGAKKQLIEYINQFEDSTLDSNHITLGFARRFAPYKRGDLLLSDPERLKAIAETCGTLQIVYAGKAHPGDDDGKAIIQRIFEVKKSLEPSIKIVFLENYTMDIAKLLVAGVDVWVNTPQPPMEASGTSGMKAALNGVPSLSVLDGWWVEGHIHGVTGWSIGDIQNRGNEQDDWANDADSLYGKLEYVICPLITKDRHRFIDMMRHCIALNGAFFNTQRMMQQYVLKAYFR